MTSTDKHVESVRDKLLQRSKVGLEKYGVTTERTDTSTLQWLIHAQEEAMDLAVYLQVLIDRHRADDDEGWIEWGGGKCPVETGQLVDVKFRD